VNRRISLAATGLLTAEAAYVGAWGALSPRAFYDAFPGFDRYWVSSDGPYNEHLVRDVGALYLALGVAGCLALVWRDDRSRALLGSAWAVFGVLHLGYHLAHLDELTFALDRVGEMVTLSGTVVLAMLVLAPGLKAAPMASRQAAR
jgi:hypothetical protein